MIYREEKNITRQDKIAYLDGINLTIQKLKSEATKKRKEYFSGFFEYPEKYRNDLKEMFGWPLNSDFNFEVEKVSQELIYSNSEYQIFRLKLRVLDDLILTGLFFKKGNERKPIILLQNGFQGTPEFMTGFYGDTSNYNDIFETVSQFDVNVFSPQLLLWEETTYDVAFSRPEIDNELRRVGSSITAIEIFVYIKAIDWLEQEFNPTSFGMIGLSYGGFYALVVAALDTRIKSVYSCSFYHNMDMLRQRSDWIWNKSGQLFSSAEFAALIYPRKLCVAMGDKDELFGSAFDSEVERLCDIFKNSDFTWFSSVKFSGAHEFYVNKTIIEKLVSDLNEE